MADDDHVLLQSVSAAHEKRGRGRPKLYARRITLRLTAEQYTALRERAQAEGKRVEVIIRAAIERELKQP